MKAEELKGIQLKSGGGKDNLHADTIILDRWLQENMFGLKEKIYRFTFNHSFYK